MAQIESIVTHIHQLERLLREQYYATGQGLTELSRSCGQRLPHSAVIELQAIAEHRQQLFEEDDYSEQELRQLLKLCIKCEKQLTPRGGRFIWGIALSLMAIVTLLALFSYVIYWDELVTYFSEV